MWHAVLVAHLLTPACCKSRAADFRASNKHSLTKKMANIKKQIPALTESEFGVLFFLFDEGARVNPDLQNHPTVRSVLFTLLNAENVAAEHAGEF